MAHSYESLTVAPELRVPYWIDRDGMPRSPVSLAELGTGYKVIYCFQHWCEGCHATGFPSLVRLVNSLGSRGVGFAVVHSVFEGAHVNTPERLRETQQRYELALPFGHDGGDEYPTIMYDYRTGGTPWFIVIDPAGRIVHSDFRINVDAAIALMTQASSSDPEDVGADGTGDSGLRWDGVLRMARLGNVAAPRRVEKSDAEWRRLLTDAQYQVTRRKGTERPFSSEMCALFEPGRYHCVCCDTPLFDASSKFDSRSGWPSFTQPLEPGVVAYHADGSHGMERVETVCHVCDAHLGHVFPDGPAPTGLRYCINALSLRKAKETP